MDLQPLRELLDVFLDWHLARIKTFSELIFSVAQARICKTQELTIHVVSKGSVNAKIRKIECLFSLQKINFANIGQVIIRLLGIVTNMLL